MLLGPDAMLDTHDTSSETHSFFPSVYDNAEIANLSKQMDRIREVQERLTAAVREQQSVVIANQKLVYREAR